MGTLITPEDFVKKWSHSKLSERSASHQHFVDLCHLLHEPTPSEMDLTGSDYTFEKGIHKTTGRHGWADVWKRACFAWEYKAHHKDLNEAYVQLQQYSPSLENPPLLIVSDMKDILIHTNWTNTISEVIEITLNDLLEYHIRKKLQWAFEKPDKLKPEKTRIQITEEIAKEFAGLAEKIRSRGYDSERVAHFLNKLIFCMFAEAEDVGLLPDHIFSKLIKACIDKPNDGNRLLKQLFGSMRKGDYFGVNKIDWFNGGLFEEADDVIPLQKNEMHSILKACDREWNDIDPVIFGTLFERCLDPQTRARLGAHYTDAASINRIIKPVITEPLKNEWLDVKVKLKNLINKYKTSDKDKNKYIKTANAIYKKFLREIQNFKILDPACGSGNFLNMALQELKELEHKIILEAEDLGFQKESPKTGPHNVMGIDINPYATELAKVSIWICDLQWVIKHGFWVSKNPILKNLEDIETRDALINEDGTETSWPKSDVIIGNPPFLGDKKMLPVLGKKYVNSLRQAFKNRLSSGSDLVTYWFEKTRSQLLNNKAKRAGLVATNSIRGGKNRSVLERICNDMKIFDAWSDLPWIIDGASVRVSIINFSHAHDRLTNHCILNNQKTNQIYSDLSGNLNGGIDVTRIKQLLQNKHISFQGMTKVGPFDIDGVIARQWLKASNPNNRLNSDILKPWQNGFDITHRIRDKWIIDFGVSMPEYEACLYELPFEYILKYIKPLRIKLESEIRRRNWWLFECTRPGLRKAISPLTKYIATPRISKHRLFVWLNKSIIPDCQIVVIARDDDTTFGILHSRFHELWSLKLCTWLGVGNNPRYTSTTTFGTFPFPEGLTPDISASKYAHEPKAKAIAEAARELNNLRETWLNPPDLIKRIHEIVKGYPDRMLPINKEAEKKLRKRTLTNLYNSKPQWLINAHKKLDDAVANAYGWETDLTEKEILKRLLELNLKRSNKI